MYYQTEMSGSYLSILKQSNIKCSLHPLEAVLWLTWKSKMSSGFHFFAGGDNLFTLCTFRATVETTWRIQCMGTRGVCR